MNKLVIFDLDGVLLDSRELHYLSLNQALREIDSSYVIGWEEHLSVYDGLPTRKKLALLSEQKCLPVTFHDTVWKNKQKATFDLISKFPVNQVLIEYMQMLKSKNIFIAVASNSVRNTVKLALLKLGILEYIDYFVSNEDVMNNKPYPEMYWKCMIACKSIPKETVIFEDSHIGRQGAIDSGAHLVAIENHYDLTKTKIIHAMELLDNTDHTNVPWQSNTLNVLIPMAGAGSRFAVAGYTFPKPLIEVNGKPMIQLVVENLNINANFIFIVQKEHYEKYHLQYLLQLIAPGCHIIQVDGVTQGAACTTLLAESLINNENPLLIANSDQFLEWNSNECMYAFTANGVDGGIVTFPATHPKWSYVSLDNEGFVEQVAEKKVISNLATAGLYFWKHGKEYVKHAQDMISHDIKVGNEFYVAPVYNNAIKAGAKIRVKNAQRMWGLGTPEDLNIFLEYNK